MRDGGEELKERLAAELEGVDAGTGFWAAPAMPMSGSCSVGCSGGGVDEEESGGAVDEGR